MNLQPLLKVLEIRHNDSAANTNYAHIRDTVDFYLANVEFRKENQNFKS